MIVCIGDSLTEGDYGVFGRTGIANVRPLSYPYFLAQLKGCEVRNFGKCGYRSTTYLQYYRDGNVSVEGAGLILIMLCTNGGHSASGESPENDAYRELIRLIRKDAPQAGICLITPPHATRNPFYSNCGYADQVEEAVGFVRKLSAELKLTCMDAANIPELCEGNEPLYQSNDGLHLNADGYRLLAERISAFLDTAAL